MVAHKVSFGQTSIRMTRDLIPDNDFLLPPEWGSGAGHARGMNRGAEGAAWPVQAPRGMEVREKSIAPRKIPLHIYFNIT